MPDNLKFPEGWHAYTWTVANGPYQNGAEVQEIANVMPYSHTITGAADDNWYANRGNIVNSGIMPFDNPQTANALGFTVDTSNYDSIFGEGGQYIKGYFLLSNDITNSFTDYKLTADMTATTHNVLEGAGSSGRLMGITGRLPVNENGVPSDEVFAGYTVTGKQSRKSGNNQYINYYENTTLSTVTQTIFGVNINKSVASVNKLDMYWHKHNRWVTSNNIAGFTVTGTGTAGSNYTTYEIGKSCSYSKWSYLATNGVANGNNAGESADIVLSVLYKGNTAVVSSPNDTNNQTFTYDNVYSTTGAVGIYVPHLGHDTFTSYANIHSFTIALANSDSEVPPYTKTPMLSTDNKTLELTAARR